MGQLGFYINSSACHGCKACELACKDKNDLKPGARLRKARQLSGGEWVKDERFGAYTPMGVFSYSVSFSCGHCTNPSCVAACPTGLHFSFEFAPILIALVVLFLVMIFRYGAQLQKEADETL